MATSGVTTYQLTAEQIINAAYRKTGVMGKGQVADAEELTYGLQALNLTISSLRTRGMQLWKLNTHTLTLTANVQEYTITQPNKAFKIHKAWILPGSTGSRIPVESISYFDYNTLPSTSSGTPVKIAYLPKNTTGAVYIWPKPSTTVASTYTFQYASLDELEVVTDTSQTLDFPSEWHLSLVWGVAAQLAIELNVPIQDRQDIKKNYEEAVQIAESGGVEEASLYVQPRLDY